MFLHWEHVPLLTHFAFFAFFISMYLVGWLCFPIMNKLPFIGDPVRFRSTIPSAHESHILYRWPLYGLCGFFYCSGLTTVGRLVGVTGPQFGWLPGPALRGGCQLLVGRARS